MIIPVTLGTRSYRIVVECGALATVGGHLRELGVGARAALVSDAAILALYGKAVRASLEGAGFAVATLEVPEGEGAKTLAVAEQSWNELLAAGPHRPPPVLGPRGGGGRGGAGLGAGAHHRRRDRLPGATTAPPPADRPPLRAGPPDP